MSEVIEKNNKKIRLVIIIAVIVAAIVIAGTVFFIAYNTPEQRIKRHLSLGEKYLAEMNYAEAILEFEMAIKIEPKTETAYIGMAKAYTAQENYEEALKVVESAIEIIGETEELLSLKTDLENKLKPEEVLSSVEDKKEEKTVDTPKEEEDWTFDLYDIWKYELFGKDINDWTPENLTQYLINNGLLNEDIGDEDIGSEWISDRYNFGSDVDHEVYLDGGDVSLFITHELDADFWSVQIDDNEYEFDSERYEFSVPEVKYSDFIAKLPSEMIELIQSGHDSISYNKKENLSIHEDSRYVIFNFSIFNDDYHGTISSGYIIEFSKDTGEIVRLQKNDYIL